MFPFRRKQPKRPDPIPPWVKWAALAFVIYAVVTNHHAPQTATGTSSTAAPSALHTDVIDAAGKRFAEYKNALLPIGIALRVEDTAPGSGHPLICGQEVTLAYSAFFEEGKPPVDRATSYHFHIGAGDAMPALEQGVVGMHVGGKRSIFARNSLAYGDTRKDIDKNATLRFDVEALSATPDLSHLDSSPFRIADTAPGGGGEAICGQPVRVQVTVWSAEGKKLFETKTPVIFTPGKSEVPLGIEQGVIGMRQGGMRTLIIPPSMQKPMHGGKPAQSFALPQPQAVIVDIEIP
jgi:FKBP-type peptidyl-prolyl cis-trans isomerase